jgi:hypothetical protein
MTMPLPHVTVRYATGEVRTMAPHFAEILVKIGKAEIVDAGTKPKRRRYKRRDMRAEPE